MIPLGEDFDYVSALQDIMWQTFFERGKTWSKLRGGNDQLPRAFAERLGTRMRYGAVVRRVTQDKEKVMLSVSRAGQLEQVEAERVVLTIPFSVLRDVELDNSFSAQKRSAIANLQYFPLTRVHLQSRSRFWTRQGVSGSADTDLPIRTIRSLKMGSGTAARMQREEDEMPRFKEEQLRFISLAPFKTPAFREIAVCITFDVLTPACRPSVIGVTPGYADDCPSYSRS
jgi:hypothetical protein